MPSRYVPKGNQRCTACGRRGHNAKNPLCPESVAKAAAAKGLRALSAELGRLEPDTGGRMRAPQQDGSVERYATVEMIQRAALAAAAKVTS